VLIGLGCSPILMGALYFLARTEQAPRFAALGSIFLGLGFLGGLLAASPLAALAQLIGWRGCLQLSALMTALSALSIWLVYYDPPQAEQPAKGSLFGDLFDLIRRPLIWPILAMSLMVTATSSTERSLWIGPFFGDVYGFSAIERGHAALALSLAMALGALLAGPVAARFNAPKNVVLVANSLSASSFLTLALFPGISAISALILVFMAGLFGMSYAVLLAHGRLFMPTHLIGRAITFLNFLSIGGSGLLQVLTGRQMEAAKAAGLSVAASYSQLHLTLGLVGLLASVLYFFAKKSPKAA
jgi:predicted MFS family arabinose efflux permease